MAKVVERAAPDYWNFRSRTCGVAENDDLPFAVQIFQSQREQQYRFILTMDSSTLT